MSNLAGNSDIDNVRSATDLVRLIGEHIALRPKGREHVGLCPFHNDKTPSFCVVTHKGNAFYKCHACGAGGDAFDFAMKYHRMEFGEALRFLADRAGIKLQPRQFTRGGGSDESADSTSSRRTDLKKANAFAATFFQRTLNDQSLGAAAREVVANRGISDDMVQAFMIGASPAEWDSLSNLVKKRGLPEQLFISAGLLKQRKEGDGCYDAFRNRLIFPICDDAGTPIAFGGRKINPEDEPKYLNSAESPLFAKSKTLYGLHRAKRAIIDSKQAIVTEGYTDVIACHQAGICNVVGTLGTALTPDHAKILSRLCETVVLVFDGDEAGMKAADRGLEVFFTEPVDIKICTLPDELDPDELLKQEDGRAKFDAAVAGAVDAMEYKINRFRATLTGAMGVSAKQKRLESFLAELSQMGFASLQGVRKRLVLAQIADLFGVSVTDIEAALPKQRRVSAAATQEVKDDADRESIPVEVVAGEGSTARRRAEEQLLAVLIYQPDLAHQEVSLGDDRCACALQLFCADDFSDPLTRTVAAAIRQSLDNGRDIVVQYLLNEVEHPAARQLVTSLYFVGERLCESGTNAGDHTEILAMVARSFDAHRNLSQFHATVSAYRESRHTPDDAIRAAQSVIEQRRRQGHIATAIGRGVRS